jgi:hypothetical protein
MIKLSELSDDLVFLDDGDVFVLDRKADRMFLVDSDIVSEITDRVTKLKILLESSVMDDNKARKEFAFALSPDRARSVCNVASHWSGVGMLFPC